MLDRCQASIQNRNTIILIQNPDSVTISLYSVTPMPWYYISVTQIFLKGGYTEYNCRARTVCRPARPSLCSKASMFRRFHIFLILHIPKALYFKGSKFRMSITGTTY